MVRAQAQGSTWYRGRQLTLQQLSGIRGRADTSSQPRRHRRLTAERVCVQSDFPCILSWNVGGLSNSILDELFIWLSRHKSIKIVLLQETRWQFSSEWESEDWHIIHGGHSKQKGSGVMTLISKDLCSAADIRVSEVASGRILHTRIPGAGGLNHLDIINVYQHAWDQRADASELKRKRARILEMLDSCIQQVPWRNLCVCGDFNVQVAPMTNLVGSCTVYSADQRQSAPDLEALVDVMVARQLVALNTWTGCKRKAYTFEHRGFRTQLDYMFVRYHQVTQQMRQCRAIDHFPVTAWRQSGLHRPLLVTINYRWQPHGRGVPSRRIDHDAIATAVVKRSPVLFAFQQDVQQKLAHTAHLTPLPYIRCSTTAFSTFRRPCRGGIFLTTIRQYRPLCIVGGITRGVAGIVSSLLSVSPMHCTAGITLPDFGHCIVRQTKLQGLRASSALTITCMRLRSTLSRITHTNSMLSFASLRLNSRSNMLKYTVLRARFSRVGRRLSV